MKSTERFGGARAAAALACLFAAAALAGPAAANSYYEKRYTGSDLLKACKDFSIVSRTESASAGTDTGVLSANCNTTSAGGPNTGAYDVSAPPPGWSEMCANTHPYTLQSMGIACMKNASVSIDLNNELGPITAYTDKGKLSWSYTNLKNCWSYGLSTSSTAVTLQATCPSHNYGGLYGYDETSTLNLKDGIENDFANGEIDPK